MRSVSRRWIVVGAVVSCAVPLFAMPAVAKPGPNYGLCNAYGRGNTATLEKKRLAPPFVRLKDAAEAQGKSVAEYCAGVAKAGKGPKTSKDKGLRT